MPGAMPVRPSNAVTRPCSSAAASTSSSSSCTEWWNCRRWAYGPDQNSSSALGDHDRRVGEQRQIADVVVVRVCHDDGRRRGRVDAQQVEGVGHVEQGRALPGLAARAGETGVHDDRAVGVPDDPEEVVHRDRRVRLTVDAVVEEDVAAHRVPRAVPDDDDLVHQPSTVAMWLAGPSSSGNRSRTRPSWPGTTVAPWSAARRLMNDSAARISARSVNAKNGHSFSICS